MKQPERLESYGEKALAANPNSIPILLMLANAYSEDAKQLPKAITYANNVISLTANSTEANQKLIRHSSDNLCYERGAAPFAFIYRRNPSMV